MTFAGIICTTILLATAVMFENENRKFFRVRKTAHAINVTGKGSDTAWNGAKPLSDFIYPWEKDTPPPTSFKSLHDDHWVYFLFEVEDDNINIYVKSNEKKEAIRSDRVELFFMTDAAMTTYYCLEMDPLARVFDCRGTFYRKLETEWRWPDGEIEVKAYRGENEYSVEGKISKKSLRELGILKGDEMATGVFRADCIQLVDGDPDFRWISWVDPKSPQPDFHIPQAFGVLKLEN